MVDLESRLVQIKAMVDNGRYFTVNRGSQFVKNWKLFLQGKEIVEVVV